MQKNLLEGLNKAQKEAVETNNCAELIVAGAGSGKTKVITYKIAYIIEKNLALANEITALTFTNKAAREMKERVITLLSERNASIDISFLTVSTFHSFAANILRANGSLLGYTKNFTIYGASDQKQLLTGIMKELNIDTKKYQPRNILSFFSSVKNETTSFIPKGVLSELYEEYNSALKKSDAMDFGDLLKLTYELFSKHPDVLKRYQDGAKFLFVDEYQDTNKIQYKLIKILSLNSDTICVVGDEDQSIYRWRGAEISNILNFEKDFKNTHIIKLEENYRSTSNIINSSSSLISKNVQRKNKVLFTNNKKGESVNIASLSTDNHEAEFILNKVDEYLQKNLEYNDMAILYRINAQSRIFEDLFRKHNVPYTLVGTTGFYERSEIKDLTAYLRFILNPHDNIALNRIIKVPSKGIGKQTLALVAELANKNDTSLYSAILSITEDKSNEYGQAKSKLIKLNSVLSDLINLVEESVSLILQSVIDRIEYIDYLKTKYKDNVDDRVSNVAEFLSATATFEENNNTKLAGFLESISLSIDEPEKEEENSVKLMTLHSAKGLEFPLVFIVGVEQNLLPYKRWGEDSSDIEEERRLAYVGMTRAKEFLFLTYARSRRIFGNYSAAIPSIFIREIDDQYTEFYEDAFEFFAEEKKKKKLVYGLEEDLVLERRTGKHNEYVGAKVFHNSYGYGMIREIEETGDNTKVTVLFKNYGTKKLIWEYAKLELC